PVEYRAWELEIGGRGGIAEGGERALLGLVELKSGLFRNGQVGLELEAGFEDPGAGIEARDGLEALSAHVLYGIARETVSFPAVALRLDASTPGTGSIGHEDWQAGAKAILTRSFGRLRLHGNGGYRIASEADGDDYWRVGLAADYPLGLFSRSVLADVYAEIPTSTGRSRVWVEVGTRLQTSNRSVLDLGVATRLDAWDQGNANVELVVGVSRILNLPWLTGVRPYPNPTIP
ncbi:MAG: hypothetical protein R3266_06875, partial [Gemmatimonadota bacterium]|nr:hypothetical protein [Gemmatimonadota bacterium]